MRLAAIAIVAVCAAAASARSARAATIKGLVYDDDNRDGVPTAGEPGHAGAVVAFDAIAFAVTDASGRFTLDVPDDAAGIVWVRAPDGYAPGPVWAIWDGRSDVELGLQKLARPVAQPFSIVVAADTHLSARQTYFGQADLAAVAREATALEPPPAFFTILGDITQGNSDAEFDDVARALGGLAMPFVPVPGNHDWWDGGLTWFRRFGPDNYSFDMGGVHFVVWNMARRDDDVRAYLGAELAHVAPGMPIVALTHAPPSDAVIQVLRELHVAYLLTGHTHTNRVHDHGGLVELGTEPLLMGGLDFTPAGYRVVTIDGGKLTSYHRTVVDAPALAIVEPAPCLGAAITAAIELGGARNDVSARVDCGPAIPLAPQGGWVWRAALPPVGKGLHVVDVTAANAAGARASRSVTAFACPPPTAAVAAEILAKLDPGADWPEAGGDAAHLGARDHELSPPLAERWSAPIGGQGLTAAPVIANGVVYAVAADLGDGTTGGITAFELVTGRVRWHVTTPVPVRASPAVAAGVVVVQTLDGVAIGLDAATGAERWRRALAAETPIAARNTLGAVAADGADVAVGNQHELALLDAATGAVRWTVEPVPLGIDSHSLAGTAIGDGLVVGAFDRAVGGVIAYDRATGARKWAVVPPYAVAVNAAPVIADGRVMFATGDAGVTAIDAGPGHAGDRAAALAWHTKLDGAGFEWGYASVGVPAYAHGTLVVPLVWRDLVALDAATGRVRWRAPATGPSPLRTVHYRGKDQPGYDASPVITGDLVWAADTAGVLVARDLATGAERGRIALGAPVLAGLAVGGDYLIAVTYDGVVHALGPAGAANRAPFAALPLAGCGAALPPPAPAPARSRWAVTASVAGALLALAVAIGLRLALRRRARR